MKLKTRIKIETKDANNGTTPKYVGYEENKLQETKTTEINQILKADSFTTS